jgi:hypothetical protein
MTFDEEKRGWAFAGAEGLEKRIAACEKLAETDAQRAAGGRTASGGRIGARAVREATPLPQSPAKGRGEPASGNRWPQLRRHDCLFGPGAIAHPGGLRADRQCYARIRRSGAVGIYDLVTGAAFKARTTKQLPVFICAQADNDQPVGMVFPLGNAGHAIDEATIGDLERECVTHALGFVPSFRTHALAGPIGNQPFVLNPPGSAQANPFWVVGAAKEVIDGHGGIWQTSFLLFIASLVFQHVQASRKAPEGATSMTPKVPVDLAAFAKSIGPIKLPQP